MVRLVIGSLKEVFKVLGNQKHLLAEDPICYFWQYSLLLEKHTKTIYERNFLLFFFPRPNNYPLHFLCFQSSMTYVKPLTKGCQIVLFLFGCLERESFSTSFIIPDRLGIVKKSSHGSNLFLCFLCGCPQEQNIFVCQWNMKHTACDWLNAPLAQDGKHLFSNGQLIRNQPGFSQIWCNLVQNVCNLL